MAEHLVRIDHGGVNRRGFYDRALGRNIARGEGHSRADAATTRLVRCEDDLIGRESVDLLEALAQYRTTLGVLPPVKVLAERRPRDGERILVQESEVAQM